MKSGNFEDGIRERLIIAGIKEIEKHGLNDFSFRRVASACEVSCAAPYRHYKNKEELVLSIISYINSRWDMMAVQIENSFEGDAYKQLTECAIGMIRFLGANPNYISVMLPLSSGIGEKHLLERDKFWSCIEKLCETFHSERNFEGEYLADKIFLLRAFISGTVTQLERMKREECERMIALARKEIDRIILSAGY